MSYFQRGLALLVSSAVALTVTDANAVCLGRSDALSTSRVIAVDPAVTPRVGRKQFPTTLGLADKEVVLTFDDGPVPGTTDRILDALHRECVSATFFVLGRNAARYPAIVRRELAEDHTVGHHTFDHPLLTLRSLAAAEAEIERGISAVETAAGQQSAQRVARTFFRFPGFASSPSLLDEMSARGLVVFGADLWASDWNLMSPSHEMQLILNRLEKSRGGILLLHDTKAQTASLVPSLLRQLKVRGFRVVHVVPAVPQPPSGAHKVVE